MDAPSSQSAWQPITPAGVAAFAHSPPRRLLLVQLIVALIVGAAMAWFTYDAYIPVIDELILRLPPAGEIRGAELNWPGPSPVLLAENRFLAVSVDLENSAKIRSTAHFQIEFTRRSYATHSLFGYLAFAYPTGWEVATNREKLEPLWGAWRPAVLALVAVGTIVGLLLTWFLLATAFTIPVWIYSRCIDRQLSLRGSWRLCGAALMPGALFMVAALSCYDLGIIDLVPMLVLFVIHFVVGWVYLLWSPRLLAPREVIRAAAKNPFAAEKSR